MDDLRVAVVGAYGRMGALTCEAVEADPGLELVARVGSRDPLDAVLDADTNVAVDFTTPATVFHNVAWLLDRGVHTVVGASGLSQEQLAELGRRVSDAYCLVAPNFAIGAVLMMRLAAQVAEHLPQAEIVEAHHEHKVDAPSGTALRTAERISHVRTTQVDVPGSADDPSRGLIHEGVPIHSVRLPGVVASQTVVFGATGQTLTIRHDTVDRRSFMPGVLLAIRAVVQRPGLTIGLDELL